MPKSINANNLKIGMQVKIPIPWFKHPFLKNEFVIKSDAQIRKLLAYGIKSVVVENHELFEYSTELATMPENNKNGIFPELEFAELIKTDRLIPDDFQDIIIDPHLKPTDKANAVYKSTISVMDQLLQAPSEQNISQFRQGMNSVVDLILRDDETSDQLINMTSHDYDTYIHSVNVGILSILLAKALFKNSDKHDMHKLGSAFFLHDIGKVNIDQDILRKKENLTLYEMDEIRRHPEEGYKILKQNNNLDQECGVVVLQHHERHNGSGYPIGLRDDEIH